jgi:NAD(P)-dependent dehydrogenase (short-subunit alcohol dehydrogenase family)
MDTPVVLITGALTGIGRAAVLAFAREGHRIVVAGRHEQAGQELASELRALGTEVEFLRADIRHEEDVRSLVDRTVTRFGRLDAAVQSENERTKAVVDQFFKAGIQGPPHDLRSVSASRLYGSRAQPSALGRSARRGSVLPWQRVAPAFRSRTENRDDFGSHRAHEDHSDDREGS